MSLATNCSGALSTFVGAQTLYPIESPVWHAQSPERVPLEPFVAKMAFKMEIGAEWKPISQVIDMVGRGKDLSAAVLKPQGYFRRFFSGESWTDWLEHRTDLGRVVRAFCDYTSNPTSVESYLEYFHIDSETLVRASKQAQAFLDQPPEPSLGLLKRFHKATLFPGAQAVQVRIPGVVVPPIQIPSPVVEPENWGLKRYREMSWAMAIANIDKALARVREIAQEIQRDAKNVSEAESVAGQLRELFDLYAIIAEAGETGLAEVDQEIRTGCQSAAEALLELMTHIGEREGMEDARKHLSRIGEFFANPDGTICKQTAEQLRDAAQAVEEFFNQLKLKMGGK